MILVKVCNFLKLFSSKWECITNQRVQEWMMSLLYSCRHCGNVEDPEDVEWDGIRILISRNMRKGGGKEKEKSRVRWREGSRVVGSQGPCFHPGAAHQNENAYNYSQGSVEMLVTRWGLGPSSTPKTVLYKKSRFPCEIITTLYFPLSSKTQQLSLTGL